MRVKWWRYWFDTFKIVANPSCVEQERWLVWTCRLMIPCADNYRPPRARNDNVKTKV